MILVALLVAFVLGALVAYSTRSKTVDKGLFGQSNRQSGLDD